MLYRALGHRVFSLLTADFDDVDDYLDVQFRLLREDFISTLRDGIAGLKRVGFNDSSKARQEESRSDIKLYRNVALNYALLGDEGVNYMLRYFFFSCMAKLPG